MSLVLCKCRERSIMAFVFANGPAPKSRGPYARSAVMAFSLNITLMVSPSSPPVSIIAPYLSGGSLILSGPVLPGLVDTTGPNHLRECRETG
jgi:hypothetical protein